MPFPWAETPVISFAPPRSRRGVSLFRGGFGDVSAFAAAFAAAVFGIGVALPLAKCPPLR